MKEKLLEFNTCDEGVAEDRMKWIEVLKEQYSDQGIDFEWWNKEVADQNEVLIHNIAKKLNLFGQIFSMLCVN